MTDELLFATAPADGGGGEGFQRCPRCEETTEITVLRERYRQENVVRAAPVRSSPGPAIEGEYAGPAEPSVLTGQPA